MLDALLGHDRFGRRLLLTAVLLNALHFAVLAVLVPRLPQTVPLRVDGSGNILLSGQPSRLYLPAAFGLLSWITNAIVGRLIYERMDQPIVAYILWGGAIAIQIGAWLSLLLLLP